MLQLVSIQLLQKAYFRQLMFEDANYSFLRCTGVLTSSVIWQQSWRTERHQLQEAAHRALQPMLEAT